jgi:pimeloyl-ACP methyl ester carboxylesterase
LTLTDTLAGVYTHEIIDIVSKSAREDRGWKTDRTGSHPALGERFRAEHPDLVVLYEELAGYGDKPSDSEMFALLGTTRFDPAEVRQLGVPTLCIVGELDNLCPPAAMQVLAELLGGAPLAIVEGCGHSPYFEDPTSFNAVLLDFIDRHRSLR